jgi:hypothetical protein
VDRQQKLHKVATTFVAMEALVQNNPPTAMLTKTNGLLVTNGAKGWCHRLGGGLPLCDDGPAAKGMQSNQYFSGTDRF